MNERIKITGNMLYNTTLGNNMGVFIETHNIEESNKLIKQLLDDQEIVERIIKKIELLEKQTNCGKWYLNEWKDILGVKK